MTKNLDLDPDPDPDPGGGEPRVGALAAALREQSREHLRLV